MSKMIQIRHVPDALHRRLRARAALAGMSLSDFLRRELEAAAGRMTMDEVGEALRTLEPVHGATPASVVIRAMRDAR